jgi:hypothetical protein
MHLRTMWSYCRVVVVVVVVVVGGCEGGVRGMGCV